MNKLLLLFVSCFLFLFCAFQASEPTSEEIPMKAEKMLTASEEEACGRNQSIYYNWGRRYDVGN